MLLEWFWWGSVFLLAVPVMAALLILGLRVLPEYRDPDAGRLDLISAAMSLVAVLAVVFGLKLIAQDGIGGLAVSAVLVGLVVGVAFARRQLHLADPMIDLGCSGTTFNASLATNLAGIFIAVGYFLFVAQYLQLVLGLSPLEAGLWSLPSAIGFIVGSNLAPRILRRVRPGPVIGAGLALAAIGLGVLTQVGGSPGADLAVLAGASLAISLGLAPVFTATTDLIVSSAPPSGPGRPRGSRRPVPSSAARSASPSWAASASPSTVASWPTPSPPASPARPPRSPGTPLAAPWAWPPRLPGAAGQALQAAAQDAFVQGMQLTVTLSATVAVVVAVMATVLLRQVPVIAQAEPGEQPPAPPEPAVAAQPEEQPIQIIRVGSGCMACPG